MKNWIPLILLISFNLPGCTSTGTSLSDQESMTTASEDSCLSIAGKYEIFSTNQYQSRSGFLHQSSEENLIEYLIGLNNLKSLYSEHPTVVQIEQTSLGNSDYLNVKVLRDWNLLHSFSLHEGKDFTCTNEGIEFTRMAGETGTMAGSVLRQRYIIRKKNNGDLAMELSETGAIYVFMVPIPVHGKSTHYWPPAKQVMGLKNSRRAILEDSYNRIYTIHGDQSTAIHKYGTSYLLSPGKYTAEIWAMINMSFYDHRFNLGYRYCDTAVEFNINDPSESGIYRLFVSFNKTSKTPEVAIKNEVNDLILGKSSCRQPSQYLTKDEVGNLILRNEARIYCRDADIGNIEAQRHIGDLYYYGLNLVLERPMTAYAEYDLVKNDPIKAYIWYSLATNGGNNYAASNLARLVNEMSQLELNRANEELEKWEPGQCEKGLLGAITNVSE
jgi:hypothetical protein